MSLYERPNPTLVKQAFRTAIREEVELPRGLIEKVKGHPVYVLGLRALGGSSTISLRQVGWQFLTEDKSHTAIGGDVPDTSFDGGPLGWSRRRGPAVSKALNAFQNLDGQEQLRDKKYEVRVLRIPALRIEAYWLKALPYQPNPASDDFVYPYLSFAGEIPEKRLLPMSNFVASAQRLAAEEIDVEHPV